MSSSRPSGGNKKEGVLYALAHDGVDLPIVDVTNPAFTVAMTETEQRTLVTRFLAEDQPFAKLPESVRRVLFRFFLRKSVLARTIRGAEGSFLSGMGTYLLKLGPDNLGTVSDQAIDRRIAAALPTLSVRLRLQDMARLLADSLLPALLAYPDRPLHFLNIGGGPAVDSLNALILLTREHPETLRARTIVIVALDLDGEGPAFGARALCALEAEGAPLQEISAELRHIRYDWADPGALEPIIRSAREARAIVAASSEGALFEYGTDVHITENLEALRRVGTDGLVVVGLVTRADEPMQRLRATTSASLILRGIDRFRELALSAGFRVTRVIERPFSDQVVLRPEAP